MKKVLLFGILSICSISAFAGNLLNTTLNPGDKAPIFFDDEGGGLTATCTVTPTGQNKNGTLEVLTTFASLSLTSNPSVQCTKISDKGETSYSCIYHAPGKITMKASAEGDAKDPGSESAFGFILSPDSSTSYTVTCDGNTW